MSKIVNLTPYTLTVAGRTFASEAAAFPEIKVTRDPATAEDLDGIPVTVAGPFTGVGPLPPAQDGVTYVVAAIVAQAIATCHPGRRDFVALGEQAEKGNPSAGHQNFQRF